jgi:NADPH:quinone reductase
MPRGANPRAQARRSSNPGARDRRRHAGLLDQSWDLQRYATTPSDTWHRVSRRYRKSRAGRNNSAGESARVYDRARAAASRRHYAEYVATPAEATFLLPDGVDFEAAAALANYQVAYHIFNDALCLRKGETVLIFAAAGGMGNALIELAKAADLKVIGVVSSEEKARFVRDLGADHVINRKEAKVSDRINEITRGRGVEAIIDPVAGPTFPENIEMLAPCGTLLIYGALGGKAQLDLLPTPRLRKNSPAVRQFTIHTWDHLIEERRAGMRALIDMLAAGKLHPRIHARLPLSEATRAHEMLESGAVVGKLLLSPEAFVTMSPNGTYRTS